MRLGLIGKHTFSATWSENSLDTPLFERLAAGCETLFIIGMSATNEWQRTREKNIELVLVPRTRFLNTLFFIWYATRCMYRYVTQSGCDVIGASEPFGGGIAALIVKRLCGVPVMAMVQGNLLDLPRQHFSRLQRAVIRRITLWVARRADAVRAVSGRIAGDLERAGIGRDKIFLLRNRVDLSRFDPAQLAHARRTLRQDWGWSDATTVLVFAGTLTVQKGFPEFVALANEILSAGRDVGVLILGDGPLRSDAAHTLGSFGSRVQFAGFVPHAEIHKFLAAADIGCFLSHHEGMPRVVLEFMAMGLAIVATPVGGVGEVVVDRRNGYLVEVGDGRAIQNAVVALLTDRSLAARLGSAARATVEQHHDLERTIQDQVEVYRMLAKRSDMRRGALNSAGPTGP